MTAPDTLETFNPHLALKAAARGDLVAQRQLAEAGVALGEQGDVQGLLDGVMFARMAAAHGEDYDKGVLIAMLGMVSAVFPAGSEMRTGAAAEAFAHSALAVDGCPDDVNAECMFGVLADTLTTEEVRQGMVGRGPVERGQ